MSPPKWLEQNISRYVAFMFETLGGSSFQRAYSKMKTENQHYQYASVVRPMPKHFRILVNASTVARMFGRCANSHVHFPRSQGVSDKTMLSNTSKACRHSRIWFGTLWHIVCRIDRWNGQPRKPGVSRQSWAARPTWYVAVLACASALSLDTIISVRVWYTLHCFSLTI